MKSLFLHYCQLQLKLLTWYYGKYQLEIDFIVRSYCNIWRMEHWFWLAFIWTRNEYEHLVPTKWWSIIETDSLNFDRIGIRFTFKRKIWSGSTILYSKWNWIKLNIGNKDQTLEKKMKQIKKWNKIKNWEKNFFKSTDWDNV